MQFLLYFLVYPRTLGSLQWDIPDWAVHRCAISFTIVSSSSVLHLLCVYLRTRLKNYRLRRPVKKSFSGLHPETSAAFPLISEPDPGKTQSLLIDARRCHGHHIKGQIRAGRTITSGWKRDRGVTIKRSLLFIWCLTMCSGSNDSKEERKKYENNKTPPSVEG